MGCHFHGTLLPCYPSGCAGNGVRAEDPAGVRGWNQQVNPDHLMRLPRCLTEECFVRAVSVLHCGTLLLDPSHSVGSVMEIIMGWSWKPQCTWYS